MMTYPTYNIVSSQESQKTVMYEWGEVDFESGTTWHNHLTVIIKTSVMEFDPNLHGVNFDASLFRSNDLSTIYSAVKQKIIWKNGKRYKGFEPSRAEPWESDTVCIEKNEVLPFRIHEESLARLIIKFKTTHLGFRYNSIIPKSAQLADSSISLVISVDGKVIKELKAILKEQNYVKFVGRGGISNGGSFKPSEGIPNLDIRQSKEKQKRDRHNENGLLPGRDNPDENHFQYPHQTDEDLIQNVFIAFDEFEDPWVQGDEIGVFTTDGNPVLAGCTKNTGSQVAILLHGDDPETDPLVEGLEEGENTYWKLWDSEAEEEIELWAEDILSGLSHRFEAREITGVFLTRHGLEDWPNDPDLDNQWHMNHTDYAPFEEETVKPNFQAAMTMFPRDKLGQRLNNARIKVGIIEKNGIYMDAETEIYHDDFNNDLIHGGGFNWTIYPENAPQNHFEAFKQISHATAVVGVMAAKVNNDLNVTGIVPDCEIFVYYLFPPNRTIDQAVTGIRTFYRTNRCKVYNHSWGGTEWSDQQIADLDNIFEDYCDTQLAINICSVSDRGDGNGYEPPAICEHTIAISAYDNFNNYNNDGGYVIFNNHNQRDDWIDFCMPGAGIRTTTINTWNLYSTTYTFNDDASSLASPQAAAIAVLAKSLNPSFSQDQFRTLCLDSPFHSPNEEEGYDRYFGWGILNAPQIIRHAYTSLNLDQDDLIARRKEPNKRSSSRFLTLSAFPNPTNGYAIVNFRSDELSDWNIKVFDICGRKLFSDDFPNNSHGKYNYRVPCQSWPAGNYLIRINGGTGNFIHSLNIIK